MEFLPAELIRKKRFGHAHTREEIHFLIQSYARDKIPDYQMAAWLMAVCFKGMTADETAAFTLEMRDSGVVLDLSHLGTSVDKHSTGGIGDKTSLIVAPLVAAAGVPVPMMAGRGLAHTGGTLDKLESISGFKVGLTLKAFQKQIEKIGTAIIGQTEKICPADRKLYALRDVTGTVDSLPLICGSIMSKKLAEGMSALVLDVKFGSGAFMKSVEESRRLAEALMDIGKLCGKNVVAMLTRMDEPLGRFVGNALEVRECLDIMEGKTLPLYEDTRELTLSLAAQMIHLGKKSKSVEEGRGIAEKLLNSGQAREKFAELVKAQGGSLARPLKFASKRHVVKAPKDGYLHYLNVEKIGLAGVHLGAGRRHRTEKLDLGAGIEIFCHQGQRVKRHAPLFELYHSGDKRVKAALPELMASFTITDQPEPRSALIAKVLNP